MNGISAALLSFMAGKDERAIFALEKILEDESVLSWQFTDGMCALIAKLPDRKVVRHFAEKYPLKFAGALVPYIFDGSEDPDLILEWLGARRAEWVTLQEIEKEKNGKARLPFPDTNPWDPSYFQALFKAGRLEEHLGSLQKTVQNAQETHSLRDAALWEYLDIARRFRGQIKLELDWIRAFPPSQAGTLIRVSETLCSLQETQTALEFALLAYEHPVTEVEVQQIMYFSSMMLTEEMAKRHFERHVLHHIAECFLAAEQPEEAQKWMLREKEFAEKHGLRVAFQFAGRVQSFSGQYVVENEIQEEEKTESLNSPEYWLKRMEYYAGRGADCEAELENACFKGLKFGETPQRQWFLRQLADHWYRKGEKKKVTDLLCTELRTMPKGSLSYQSAVWYMIDSTRDGILDLSRPELWQVLAEMENWQFSGERLIRRMVECALEEDIQALGRRPRSLEETKGERFREVTARIGELADRPERAAYWGWVLDRKGEPQAGVPFLELGMRSKDEQIAACAAFTLMEVRAKLGEWEKAELLLPAASKHLTLREKKDWFGRIAEGARKAGASDVAERCERKLKNLGRY
ncbi:MAG: hypothetical protein E7029_03365 [Planctomycetaceae bacterium]|nr:hypothetical protein [Planctomycetaceae bacterium]